MIGPKFLRILGLVILSLTLGSGEVLAEEKSTPVQGTPQAVAPKPVSQSNNKPGVLQPRGPGKLVISPKSKLVYVIPVREEVSEQLLYMVRRGVKEACVHQADLIILDMKTPGGRVDSMMEIMDVMERSSVETLTFVNNESYSAGAFIAASTQHIFMAPSSVIGAAAPVILGSEGPKELPHKFVSAVAAKMRAAAERNGYLPQVLEKMVDKEMDLPFSIANRKLEKGMILTLTNTEAEFAVPYNPGEAPRSILSSGTVKDRDELLKTIGLDGVKVVEVSRTGAESFAVFINSISFVLLSLGLLGAWFEIKTQSFGIIGFFALICFLLFFFGQYTAALSGMETLVTCLVVFGLGTVLVLADVYLFGGSVGLGLVGILMMVGGLLFAMVDRYPGAAPVPLWDELQTPLTTLFEALVVTVFLVALLGRFLPSSPLFKRLTLAQPPGPLTISAASADWVGTVGIAQSPLRPSGKARFGPRLVDVVTQGELIEPNTKIKVIAVEGTRIVVSEV